MKILESAENYLKTMLSLEEENGCIRSIDIANRLCVSKPSVSIATRKLRESGYISMDPNGPISLTAPGRKIAIRIRNRHQALTRFLELLGVEPEQASEDACKMEHDISHDTYAAICKYINEHTGEELSYYDED